MALTFALGSYPGTNPPGGHSRGHAPEMTDVAMMLAGLTSVAGYLLIRRRFNRQK